MSDYWVDEWYRKEYAWARSNWCPVCKRSFCIYEYDCYEYPRKPDGTSGERVGVTRLPSEGGAGGFGEPARGRKGPAGSSQESAPVAPWWEAVTF